MAEETVKKNASVETAPSAPEEEKPGHTMHPVADVFDSRDGIEITFEIPGAGRKDIALEVKDHLLSLVAKSSLKKHGVPVTYRRSFYLSDAMDAAKIAATVKDGVLTLFIPKSESAKPHQIKVQ